jgi:hypothetical protein
VERGEYRMKHFLEWHKLAMLMLGVPITSVEPECCFSLLDPVKTDLHTPHDGGAPQRLCAHCLMPARRGHVRPQARDGAGLA